MERALSRRVRSRRTAFDLRSQLVAFRRAKSPALQHADTGAANSSANCSTVSASAPEARRRRNAFMREVAAIIWRRVTTRASPYGVRKAACRPVPRIAGLFRRFWRHAVACERQRLRTAERRSQLRERVTRPSGSDPDLCCRSSPSDPCAAADTGGLSRRVPSRVVLGLATELHGSGTTGIGAGAKISSCRCHRIVLLPSACSRRWGRRDLCRVDHVGRVGRRLRALPGPEDDRAGRDEEGREHRIGIRGVIKSVCKSTNGWKRAGGELVAGQPL